MGRLLRGRWIVQALMIALAAMVVSTVHSPLATGLTHQDHGAQRNDVWPKKIDEFLSGEYLQKADVMLEHRWSGDVAAWVIRWATNSLFSHAALVYTAPPYDSGIANTFVIEAGTKGVDLTKLTDYIGDNRVNFIAVKRLKPQAWFDGNHQARVSRSSGK